MGDEQAQRLVEHSAAILRRGGTPEAAKYVKRALEIDPSNAAAHRLQGIVLAQMGRKEEALESLRRATMLDPTDACSLYNYALQLGKTGQTDEARDVVERAVRARPNYRPALELSECLSRGECNGFFDPGVVHSIGWVGEAGAAWTGIGWSIVVFAVLMFVLNLSLRPFTISGGAQASVHLDPGFGAVALIFLTAVGQIGVFVWMVTDLIDRRGRVIWLVPLMVLAFFGGLAMMPMALYLWVSRRDS